MDSCSKTNEAEFTSRLVKIVLKSSKNKTMNIYAKCEFENPSNSHKDRTYKYIIDNLERNSIINKKMTLVDCSTGNGGAALARICALRGYKCIIFMPEGMTDERIMQIHEYGASIIETPKDEFLNGSVKQANIYTRERKNHYFIDQASNLLNSEAWEDCGEEIVRELKKQKISLDYFICAIGTGGTFSGIAKKLKQHYTNLKTIGIEVDASAPIYRKRQNKPFQHKPHNLMGLGAGIISCNTFENLIDDIRIISGKVAWDEMKSTINDHGIMIGPTCGANINTCKQILEESNKDVINVATVFFDSSWKYHSRWDGVYPEYNDCNNEAI